MYLESAYVNDVAPACGASQGESVSRAFERDRLGVCPGRQLRVDCPEPAPLRVLVADTPERRRMARDLAARRYAWRRYEFTDANNSSFPDAKRSPHYTTLLAVEQGRPVATVTVGFDSPHGLLVDEVNRTEVAALRAAGGRVVEFVRLAFEDGVDSKRVWMAMLEPMVTLCLVSYRASDILIEVNPRHVPFYKRVFGFEAIAPERTCPRVGAPSILLRLTAERLRRKVGAMPAAVPMAISKDREAVAA